MVWASVSCLLFLQTPMWSGSSSHEQQVELHQSCSYTRLFYSVNSLLGFFTKLFPFRSLLALTQFLLGLAVTGSPLFQCLICVERYLAVVHPVTFLKYKPLRYRVICCTVVWIITLGSSIICMLTFLKFIFYMCMWFLLLQFLLFLSIKLFCCLAVLRTLKQSGPGERGRQREEENHVKTSISSHSYNWWTRLLHMFHLL